MMLEIGNVLEGGGLQRVNVGFRSVSYAVVLGGGDGCLYIVKKKFLPNTEVETWIKLLWGIIGISEGATFDCRMLFALHNNWAKLCEAVFSFWVSNDTTTKLQSTISVIHFLFGRLLGNLISNYTYWAQYLSLMEINQQFWISLKTLMHSMNHVKLTAKNTVSFALSAFWH